MATMIQILPWLLAVAVATERLVHHRSRGSGASWYALAFILCSVSAAMILIFQGSLPLPVRLVLGTAAVVSAITGGVYLPSRQASDPAGSTSTSP